MKTSIVLIFVAIAGVIAWLFLSKKQTGAPGTNTIVGSTGSAQPATVLSKTAQDRTNSALGYVQAGAGLLSSLIGSISKSGAGASASYSGNLPFLPGQIGGRDSIDPTAPGISTQRIFSGYGSGPISAPGAPFSGDVVSPGIPYNDFGAVTSGPYIDSGNDSGGSPFSDTSGN